MTCGVGPGCRICHKLARQESKQAIEAATKLLVDGLEEVFDRHTAYLSAELPDDRTQGKLLVYEAGERVLKNALDLPTSAGFADMVEAIERLKRRARLRVKRKR